jgi:dethiobiotin synthetase
MRLFLVGTDTDVGKTTLACALVRAGEAAGLRVLPFKPAASGPDGPQADPERLVAACSLGVTARDICPLRYPEPLAPGIAEDRGFRAAMPERVDEVAAGAGLIGHVRSVLDALVAEVRPDVTLVEGAGGLWVPMPGGTWLPTWIAGLGAAPVVVGRLGLGTINHTLLTIAALRQLGLPPRGFFLNDTTGAGDPSCADNPAVITAASGLPCLGILPYGAGGEWLRADAWARLADRT